jgi:hypothetical protein
MLMGDPSLMMLGGQHHGGIIAKEEKDESDLASYTSPIMSTHDLMGNHDLMSNSAIGLSLHGEGGEDEEDYEHSSFNITAYESEKGVPQEPHHEPAIPRLMQIQMEKYL